MDPNLKVQLLIYSYGPKIIDGTITDEELRYLANNLRNERTRTINGKAGIPLSDIFVKAIAPHLTESNLSALNAKLFAIEGPASGTEYFFRNPSVATSFMMYELNQKLPGILQNLGQNPRRDQIAQEFKFLFDYLKATTWEGKINKAALDFFLVEYQLVYFPNDRENIRNAGKWLKDINTIEYFDSLPNKSMEEAHVPSRLTSNPTSTFSQIIVKIGFNLITLFHLEGKKEIAEKEISSVIDHISKENIIQALNLLAVLQEINDTFKPDAHNEIKKYLLNQFAKLWGIHKSSRIKNDNVEKAFHHHPFTKEILEADNKRKWQLPYEEQNRDQMKKIAISKITPAVPVAKKLPEMSGHRRKWQLPDRTGSEARPDDTSKASKVTLQPHRKPKAQ